MLVAEAETPTRLEVTSAPWALWGRRLSKDGDMALLLCELPLGPTVPA